MDETLIRFLLAEFDALRREIEHEIGELGELLRYGLVSSGALWAWLLSQPSGGMRKVAAFLPFVISLALFVEVLLVRQHIRGIGIYILKIEGYFRLPEDLGWESHLLTGSRKLGRKDDPIEILENLVWIVLICCNLIGGLLLGFWISN